jgi:hypothetical protein
MLDLNEEMLACLQMQKTNCFELVSLKQQESIYFKIKSVLKIKRPLNLLLQSTDKMKKLRIYAEGGTLLYDGLGLN